MGLSYEGFEQEVMSLFKTIEKRRMALDVVESKLVECKRFKNELKKLESSINYDRKMEGTSVGGMRKGKGISKCVKWI